MFRVLLDFAEKEGIDVMILGSRENKTMVQQMVPGTKKLSSTSDQFKARAKCPVLVIRPAVSPPLSMAPCSCLCMTRCLEPLTPAGARCRLHETRRCAYRPAMPAPLWPTYSSRMPRWAGHSQHAAHTMLPPQQPEWPTRQGRCQPRLSDMSGVLQF